MKNKLLDCVIKHEDQFEEECQLRLDELDEKATRNAAERIKQIDKQPISPVDLSRLDLEAKRLFEDLRREFSAPIAKYSNSKFGDYLKPVELYGTVFYMRGKNVWDRVEGWIESLSSYGDAHEISSGYFYNQIFNVYSDLKFLCSCGDCNIIKISKNIVEEVIRECVSYYEKIHSLTDPAYELKSIRSELSNVVEMVRERTRRDKGKKHIKRKNISNAWRSARDVADDFNKSAFVSKYGKRKLGACSEAKINRWDKDHPTYDKRNKFGYYAELRINPDLKSDYYKVLQVWRRHWSDYKKWDIRHPGSKYRPMKTVDLNIDRIGIDDNNDKRYIEPDNDNYDM